MINKTITGIYIRVSTEDQAKDGFSIHAQREKLAKYAEANDWDIFDYYVDDGISGKDLDGRPEVTRLINDVKEGKINNVLIYKLDRLTRSVRDLIYLIELFEKYSCTFNSQTEKIDTSNAVGRMFVKIIGIFAEFERENLAERVSFGYEQKTREGNYTNTCGVYGYDYLGNNVYAVNEEEKNLVNRIFDLYIDGLSYYKIAKKLNNENLPTKRGGHWATGTIKSIITNPLYIGQVRYGVQPKNKDKSFSVEGKNIEAIVEAEKWESANKAVATRQKFCMRRYSSDNSYYFHIIKCAKCGGGIGARQQNQKGTKYITYRCYNASRGFCECGGFSHKIMEDTFMEYLDTLGNMKPDDSIFEKKNNLVNYQKQEEQLKNKIDKLYLKKKTIRNQFVNELLTIEEYREMIQEIDNQISKLNDSLVNINAKTLENTEDFSYEEVKELITNIKLNWENLNNKERKQFLEQFVDKIMVEKINDKVIIKNVEFKR